MAGPGVGEGKAACRGPDFAEAFYCLFLVRVVDAAQGPQREGPPLSLSPLHRVRLHALVTDNNIQPPTYLVRQSELCTATVEPAKVAIGSVVISLKQTGQFYR